MTGPRHWAPWFSDPGEPPHIDLAEMAGLLDESPAHVLALVRRGEVPPPLNLDHGPPVWSRREVYRWLEAGCPRVRRPK